MPKYTNVVRFKEKSGQQAEFESLLSKAKKWDGHLLQILARTGEQSYVSYGLWESEERMKNAMPQNSLGGNGGSDRD